jgi:hypothetical protein
MNQVANIITLSQNLDKLNNDYKHILSQPFTEKILYIPIFVRKVMPKKFPSTFFRNDRYLMFTNKKLYNLDSKQFDSGEIQQNHLIKNSIDISYISHLIF